MSRLEYNEDNNLNNFDDDSQWRTNNMFNQTHCTYCFDPHCNTVGLISAKHKAWFCSGACQTMYFYDNKLATYSSDTVAVIQEMRKKFYSEEKLKERKKKNNYH